MYSSNASINWMFVEGLLLHSRVTTNVFTQDAPFKTYYAIGWGLPLVFVVPWAIHTEHTLGDRSLCWEGYATSPAAWLLIAPRLVAILMNSVFLVNIIRILVTRVASVTAEHQQVWKAIKATMLLLPLLGITHLLCAIHPPEAQPHFRHTYLVVNAALQSSQGIFVSVIHCFMNTDVQMCLRNAYLRAAIRRNPNRQSVIPFTHSSHIVRDLHRSRKAQGSVSSEVHRPVSAQENRAGKRGRQIVIEFERNTGRVKERRVI